MPTSKQNRQCEPDKHNMILRDLYDLKNYITQRTDIEPVEKMAVVRKLRRICLQLGSKRENQYLLKLGNKW